MFEMKTIRMNRGKKLLYNVYFNCLMRPFLFYYLLRITKILNNTNFIIIEFVLKRGFDILCQTAVYETTS